MESGVYKIKCLITNKVYVGSSKNIKHRWSVHQRQLNNNTHINRYLLNAWIKYGKHNFQFEVIENCEISNLLIREQYWMDYYKSYDRSKGFNNCIKSDRPLGYKHPDDIKEKMSRIKKEQIKNGLKCNLIRKPKGYKHSKETISKISNSKKGSLNPRYGFKESEESKKKRMKNMLNKPRWNKGLTKDTDPRIYKLGLSRKGKLPHNAIHHILICKLTNNKWEDVSLTGLSKKCPLSLPSLVRLKNKTASNNIINKYELKW